MAWQACLLMAALVGVAAREPLVAMGLAIVGEQAAQDPLTHTQGQALPALAEAEAALMTVGLAAQREQAVAARVETDLVLPEALALQTLVEAQAEATVWLAGVRAS